MLFVRGERPRDQMVRIVFRHVRMTPAALGLRALSFEDEPTPALVKHLSGAGVELLSTHLAIETNADVTRGEFALL